MSNAVQFSKAYKEVLEILKYIPKQDYDKIPKYILENMEKKQDKEYKYEVVKFKEFEQQEMLRETEAILSVLFREYWATEEQRKWLEQKEYLEKRKIEEEKRKNYIPANNIFIKEENNINKNSHENSLQEIKEDNFMKKLIIKIKNFLKNRS